MTQEHDDKAFQTTQLSEGDWEEIAPEHMRHEHATGQLSPHQIAELQHLEIKAKKENEQARRDQLEAQMQTVKLTTVDLDMLAKARNPKKPSRHPTQTMEATSSQWARYFDTNPLPNFVFAYMTNARQSTLARWWEGMHSLPSSYNNEIGIVLSSRIKGREQTKLANSIIDWFENLQFTLTVQWMGTNADHYGQLLIFNRGFGYTFQQLIAQAPQQSLIDAKLIHNAINNYMPKRVVLFNPQETPMDTNVVFGGQDLLCTQVIY